MRVAVTGTTGRVGSALARHLSARHEIIPLPRNVCDLGNPESLADALEGLECDVLINPAGITDLEVCEDDPQMAMRVNSAAPGKMAEWAAERDVHFFHFSTDYVFAGEAPSLRNERETPHPLSAYGRSKFAGECVVLAQPGTCVIRVSWVFGPEKPSFIDRIFDTALAGMPLTAIADKFSVPTFTADLAEWMELLISRKTEGVLHACNSGDPVSWHGMACAIVQEMFACGAIRSLPEITPLKLENVSAFRAVRPKFTAMDSSRLAEEIGKTPRPWREAIATYVRYRCESL